MHGAREQSFRFRKDLGLPNQVCLFRWTQYSDATGGVQIEHEPDPALFGLGGIAERQSIRSR